MTISYPIYNRFTGAVQFTAEIDCSEDTSLSVRVGLSVKWAIANKQNLRDANLRDANLRDADLRGADLGGADLRGADLRGADLRGANLRGANLRGANLGGADLCGADLRGANLCYADLRYADLGDVCLIDSGQRSDGYRFVGWVKDDVLQIRAGCRNFSIAEAREHWQKTRSGTVLGSETSAILDHIETVARVRGLIK